MCYNHVGLLPKYIAMCLYQVGKHQAAASAAFTNLAVNPEVSRHSQRSKMYKSFLSRRR